jgi:hypothetical protein
MRLGYWRTAGRDLGGIEVPAWREGQERLQQLSTSFAGGHV